MPPDRRPTSRPWQLIAEEASREADPIRLAALIEEMNRALEERDRVIVEPPARKESA